MESVTDTGRLIAARPEIRGGRPCIAGTGLSVRRIAQWNNLGLLPEEIARRIGHLSLAQVQAALAYYHANQAAIDADLEAESRAIEALEQAPDRLRRFCARFKFISTTGSPRCREDCF